MLFCTNLWPLQGTVNSTTKTNTFSTRIEENVCFIDRWLNILQILQTQNTTNFNSPCVTLGMISSCHLNCVHMELGVNGVLCVCEQAWGMQLYFVQALCASQISEWMSHTSIL